MSEASDMIRKMFGEGDAKRDAGLSTPDGIIRYDDIVYGQESDWQKLDIYIPKETSTDKLPVIISVHGGGWVYGDKECYQFYCMDLALRGFAVVNFSYRLAPEYKFPAPLEDTNTVINYVLDNADKYGFDSEKIFMVGDSAGAHIAALYANICTNPEYASCFDFSAPSNFKPTALCLNCGAYVLNPQKDAIVADFLPDYNNPAALSMVNVLEHISTNFPPTLYMTCTGDFLLAQAGLLSEKLINNKIPHEFHFYGDSELELGHVFHLNIRSDAAKECNDDECAFFRRFV